MHNILSLLFLFLILFSCETKKTIDDSDTVFAYVNSEPIYRSEVDKIVAQELYDELCRIYLIREIALSDLIEEKIVANKAKSYNITVDSLYSRYYDSEINDSTLLYYAMQYPQYTTIKKRGDSLRFISEKDKNEFFKIIKAELRDKLYHQLSSEQNIKTLLKAPSSPRLDIHYDIVHYKGNLSSPITCLIISDLECPKCKEYTPVFDSIYRTYADQVKFGYTHYGSEVTISSIASECAGLQNKFWEMHDSIMKKVTILDSSDIFMIARQIGLNMEKFSEDFCDTKIADRIFTNMKKIENSGIYGTPTIVINNRILFNSSSFEDIEQLILEEKKELKN